MVEGGIACGECWHMFASPQELVDDYNKLAAELDLRVVKTAEQVYSCPHCAHDF
jgi:hypothetical protein